MSGIGLRPTSRAVPAWIVALALLVAAVGTIALKAWLDADGYLSPDSTNYLALVENLRAGRGLVIANSGRVPQAYSAFAEWPAGYPLLIYAVAQLTGLSAFLASKLVSAVLFLASATLIVRAFPRHGAVLACVLCFGASVEVFSYTWSEVPFTFGLIALAVLTARVLRDEERLAASNALLLLACAVWLFLSRYIGAFAIAQIAMLAGFKLWRRQYRSASMLAAAAVAAAAVVAAYLWWNALQTGHPTGMERPASTDPAMLLLRQLAVAVAGELAIVVPPHSLTQPAEWLIALLCVIAAVGAGIVRPRPRQVAGGSRLEALAFLWVGALYLAAIVAMRWTKQFDPFDFRLLNPGFVPLFVGLFALLLRRNPRGGAALLLAAAAVSLTSHVATAIVRYDGRTYLVHARDVRQRYGDTPTGATVVFGDELARFLRPDLHIDAPCSEQGEDCSASWEDYLDDLAPGRAVYVDIDEEALTPDHHSPSVRAFVAAHKPGVLVRVR